MNSFENNILSRCCHLVYHQLLTGRADTALASVERMTTLIRYMADTASSRTSLGEELAIVRTVFELYQADGRDGAFSVEWLSQGVYYTSQHSISYRDFNYCPCGFDDIALLDFSVRTQDNNTYVVFLKVLGHAVDIVIELDQFSGHTVIEAIDTSDAVSDLDDRTEIGYVQFAFVILDLFLDNRTDLFRS